MGLVIREAIERGLDRIRANEPLVRQGDVEGVHRLRTTTRRLRSELRLFRGLVDDTWAEGQEAELKWLARGLGDVRDLDVLQFRLQAASGELADALAPLFATLQGRRDAALASLHRMMDDERYRQLADGLAEAVDRPDSIMTDRPDESSRSSLTTRAGDAWRSLRKAARRLDASSPDEDFHRVRKRAKRALHAAEVVTGILKPGDVKEADRFMRRLTRVKDVLGEHQDAVVACGVIEQIAAERPDDGPSNLASGRLIERQAQASHEARRRFFGAWDRLDRKSIRSWLG
jgi:CHAD domain-containing protein